MKKIVAGVCVGVASFVAAVVGAAPAEAGSNNGTTNWWWHKACWVNSVTNLDVTNYDYRMPSGWGKQRYHVDADKGTTRIEWITVFFDGRPTYRWNDFYITQDNRYSHKITLKTNLGSCSVTG